MSESDPNHYLEEYHFDLLQELCDFCESDDLSLSKLQEKIKPVPTHVIRGEYYNYKPFFHKLCLNENITVDVVEYMIHEFPGTIR